MGYAVRKDARDVASSSSPLDRTPNDVDDEMEGDCFVSAVPKDLFVAASVSYTHLTLPTILRV